MRPPRFAIAVFLVLTALMSTAGPGGAQTAPPNRSGPSDRLVAEGDSLRGLLRPLKALERYQAALEMDSAHYEALWKSSREAVTLGMLAADQDASKEWYRTAEGYARRAVGKAPADARGHEWLAISLGRRALREGPRTRVELSEAVRREALAALAADSLSPAAHHVLGQWNAEVRRLSGITRLVARKLLGGDAMDQASWEAAERHLRRAVELAPSGLVHRLELARILIDTDRPELARDHLRMVLDLPPVDPADPLHKQDAQELLRRLR